MVKEPKSAERFMRLLVQQDMCKRSWENLLAKPNAKSCLWKSVVPAALPKKAMRNATIKKVYF